MDGAPLEGTDIWGHRKYFHDLIKDHCRWRAISPSNILDRRVASVKRSPCGKLDFMLYQAPFRTLIGHPVVQMILIAIGIYQLQQVFVVVLGIESYGVKQVSGIRFSGAVSSSIESSELNFSMVRLMFRGCEFLAHDVSESNPAILNLSRPARLDGIVLNFLEPDNTTRLLSFKVFGTNDNWITANIIGSSDFRFGRTDVRFLDTAVPFRPQFSFDYQPKLAYLAYTICHHILWSILSFSMGICGFINQSAIGRAICIWALGAAGIVACLSSAGLLLIQQEKEAFAPLVNAFVYAAVAAILLMAETRIINAFLVLGLASFALHNINDCAVFHDCENTLVDPPIVSIIFAVVGAVLIAMRRRSFLRAVEGVEEDRAAYDALWHAVVATDRAGAETLDAYVQKLAASCGGPVRQLNRQVYKEDQATSFVSRVFQGGGAGDGMEGTGLGELRSIPGSPGLARVPALLGVELLLRPRFRVPAEMRGRRTDPSSPVRSLDQLYAQASAAVYFLHTHCAEWAAVSKGALDVSEQGAGARSPGGHGSQQTPLDDVSDTVARWVEARLIKRPARTVEKLLACYSADASRLLDICRARILFTRLTDVLYCTKAVRAAAPLVRIVGVKNSLRDGHDSRLTGGFRCVVLYICFDNPDARCLGVEGHICELQLALKSFVDAQDVHAHARYHAFRAIPTRVAKLQHRSLCGLGIISSNRIWATEGCLNEEVTVHIEAKKGYQADEIPYERLQKNVEADSFEHEIQPARSDPCCFEHLECAQEKLRIGIEIFQRSALLSGSILDEAVTNVFKAVNLSSSSSVMFTSKPLAAMASKPIFKLFFIGMSVFTGYSCGVALSAFFRNGKFASNLVRLRILETRGVISGIQQVPAISTFGLLLNGCPVVMTNIGINNTWTINQNEVPFSNKEVNGYFFLPSSSVSELAYATSWRVESSQDNGSSWALVGASVWRLNPSGIPELYPELKNDKHAEGSNIEINVKAIGGDMRPPLSWTLNTIGEYAIFSMGFAGMSATSLRGQVQHAGKFWVSMLFVDAMLYTAANAVIIRTEPWLWREAAESWMDIMAQLLLGFSTLLDEERCIRILVVFCAVNTVSNTLGDVYLYDLNCLDVLYDRLYTMSGLGLFFGVGVLLFRQRALLRAQALIVDDKRKYDAIWQDIISNPDTKAAILCIQEAAINLSKFAVAVPKQRMHKMKTGPTFVFDWTALYNTHGRRKSIKESKMWGLWRGSSRLGSDLVKVNSLDQLFVQAWCLSPILLSKTKFWARQCKGFFPYQADGSDSIVFKLYTEEEEGLGPHFKWAKVKSIHRAVEKVVRVYRQDVSSIVDLCRQSIVFDDLKDIAACMRLIHADSDVHVLRVKNRLDMKHRSAISAGYRDVGINLQIITSETRIAGIDSHICELQLIYKPTAELKTEEGHSGYVAFRNIRGE